MQTHTRSGFTLIELLLYVGITSIILFAISLFFSILLQSRIKSDTVTDVEQQGTQAMLVMTQAIRNADAVNAPLPGASASSLSLTTSSTGPSPTVFSLSGGALTLTQGAAAPIALTNNRVTVSALRFTNLARPGTPDIVRISFALTAVNATGRTEYRYTQTFLGSAQRRP
ncbi:MAG TPA: prepilin-type N-terminal cleavage/methylation domain-containing protein [Candidatus Paceibacterota bacterium]